MPRPPDVADATTQFRRRRRRRRQAFVAAFVVAAVAVGAFVLLTDDHEISRRARSSSAPTTIATSPPPTLVSSPDQITPPRSAEATAATLIRVERAVRSDDRDPAVLRVVGWEQQLAYRQLSNHPDWVDATMAALPADVRLWAERNVAASTGLSAITPAESQLPDWTIIAPPPAETLRGYYNEAEQDFGIPWAYLAAIHFLETRLGRIHGNSSAGAQGPMQFIPSTWAAYGNGGDVNDNHDAILAAGRYLKAAGGPANMDKAIYAYNHDDGYVAAVKAYASNMLEDARAYDGYYHWQVYYRTVDGTFLLPEGWHAGGPVVPHTLPPA
jgi:membrane-bound lytic murein transglycosylase B